jgi:hypothetical protein
MYIQKVYILEETGFEWDERKNRANLGKQQQHPGSRIHRTPGKYHPDYFSAKGEKA